LPSFGPYGIKLLHLISGMKKSLRPLFLYNVSSTCNLHHVQDKFWNCIQTEMA